MIPSQKQAQHRSKEKTYVLGNTFVTESSLFLGESDTSDLASVVLGSESGQGTPSTTDIKQVVLGFQVELS